MRAPTYLVSAIFTMATLTTARPQDNPADFTQDTAPQPTAILSSAMSVISSVTESPSGKTFGIIPVPSSSDTDMPTTLLTDTAAPTQGFTTAHGPMISGTSTVDGTPSSSGGGMATIQTSMPPKPSVTGATSTSTNGSTSGTGNASGGGASSTNTPAGAINVRSDLGLMGGLMIGVLGFLVA